MAAILATKPKPIEELVPLAPPALERVVTRCLAKDPDDRWQTARDIAAIRDNGVQPLGAPLVSEGPLGRIRHHPGRLATTITACARFGGRPPAAPRRGQ